MVRFRFYFFIFCHLLKWCGNLRLTQCLWGSRRSSRYSTAGWYSISYIFWYACDTTMLYFHDLKRTSLLTVWRLFRLIANLGAGAQLSLDGMAMICIRFVSSRLSFLTQLHLPAARWLQPLSRLDSNWALAMILPLSPRSLRTTTQCTFCLNHLLGPVSNFW